MTFLRMENINLKDKRVLVREDLNVAIENGVISNDTRIRAAIPTIKQALAAGGKVILMSHLGRPEEGIAIEKQPDSSLAPVARRLEELLQCKVSLISDYLQNPASIDAITEGVILLENVRVNSGEIKNNDALARQYAALCDVFVMDAFGTAHRAQASTHGVARHAAIACAGPLLASELDALSRSLEKPERPMLAIVGGAKVSSKLEVLQNLAGKVDQLIVGGGIANTFLVACGYNVGKSLYEAELVPVAKALMEQTTIPMPTDVVVATEFSAQAIARVKSVDAVADGEMILDIGPKSAQAFAEIVSRMQTIIWNGPLGVFEFDQFAEGTAKIAQAIARNKGFSIAGGGETIAAIDKFGVTDSISYISTGGGAFLEYVQGTKLPSVQILEERAAKLA